MFRLVKFIAYSLLVLILLAVVLWRLCSQELATYASAKIANVAIGQNVFLNFTESNFGLFNFQSKVLAIEVAKQKIPLRLELQNLKVSPVITSLFSDEQAIDFSFNLLQGQVTGRLYRGDQGVGLKNLEVRDIELFQVSLMKLIGFSSGTFSLDLDRLLMIANKTQIQNLKFEFKNFVKKDASVIPSWMSGLPMNLNLEPIVIQKFSAAINQDSLFQVKDFILDSDWGSIMADFLLSPLPEGIQISKGQGDVQLKDSGSKQFSPFLSLFSNQQLRPETRQFSFKFLEYQSGFPRFNFTPK